MRSRASKDHSFVHCLIFLIGLITILIFLSTNLAVGTGELIVDPEGGADHTTIQQAIDNASSGEIIRVNAGHYRENLLINISVTIIGSDAGEVIIDGNGTGDAIVVTANDLGIRQVTITGGGDGEDDFGIRASGNGISLTDIIVSGNGRHGIWIEEGNDLVISGISCVDQFNSGMILENIHNASIMNSTISNNGQFGLLINYATDSTFSNNAIQNNILRGIDFHFSTNNDIENNLITNTYQALLILEGSDNNRIIGNNCSSNNFTGITLISSSNNLVKDNECRFNALYHGIDLNTNSLNNTIINNTSTNNGFCGVYLHGGCEGNSILGNTVTANRYAVFLREGCTGNEVHENWFFNNNEGVTADEGSPVNATNNFWGHNSGPWHNRTNPEGKGSIVSDHVTYVPWLTLAENPPTAFIESILPGSCEQGALVVFNGSGADDGMIVSYTWTSSIDGVLHSGPIPRFDYYEFSLGEHMITLVAEDDVGLFSDPVTGLLTVYEPIGANERPHVTIEHPVGLSTVQEVVIMRGTATDPNGNDSIVKVEVRIGGGTWMEADLNSTSGKWTYDWNSEEWANGNYSIEVRAFDGTLYSPAAQLDVKTDNDENDRSGWICVGFTFLLACLFLILYYMNGQNQWVTRLLGLISGDTDD